MEQKGLLVNHTLYEEEARVFNCMKHSTENRFNHLRTEFEKTVDRHFDRPSTLASDYVLGRVFKHCCIIFNFENLLGQPQIEKEFQHFKEEFENRIKRDDSKQSLLELVRQIHHFRKEILQSEQTPDFFAKAGV
jgi:hypothetical protein